MTIVWSYWGGVQSVCIGVLVREGVLPKPDLAVIADTGREVRSTWDYLRDHMQPYLDPVGVTIEIAPHSLAGRDLNGPDGLTLVPAYTAVGRLSSYCSGHWKRDVIERWLRREKQVKECVQWIGYSIDELRRVPQKDHRSWCKLEFPLIDKHINRAVAIGIIQRAGLPVPRKSRCWMCPHQDETEWQEIWESPEEWEAACRLEEEINASDPEQTGKLYLHNSRVPLRQVDLSQGIPLPSAPCEGGHCWT